MALSAEFSVDGDSTVSEHLTTYGATVALAALSLSFRTITWEIVSSSKSGSTAPTITLAGAPTGATASFVQVADPSDGLGRSWVVKCTQTDAAGNESVAYRVVGTLNANSTLPICADEQNWRDATHGWSQSYNRLLASGGGGVTDHGALGGLADDDHTQYELAARPQSTYTGAANTTVLGDARKHVTTSHGSANTLTIPPNASVAYATDSLLFGTNIGAGTMTLTAGAGVTLNGSLAVAQYGWWWAKKTAVNTWYCFVGGASSLAHSALTGLTSGDDHTQYSLVTGTRAFTGGVTVTQAAVAASTPVALRVTGGAHTASIASAELVDADFALNRTVQFATGAITTQRAGLFRAPTYGFVGASVITDAATVAITDAPTAGTNATITNKYALWVQAGNVRIGAFTAGLVLASSTGVLSSSLGSALQQVRVNSGGTGLEYFSPPSPVVGTDLTNANVTKNISDGSQFTLPASTLASSAKTLTFGTSGTPETGEIVEVIVYSQGQDFNVSNGGPLADTLYTITAGTKRVVHIQWNGTDWRAAGKIRLT